MSLIYSENFAAGGGTTILPPVYELRTGTISNTDVTPTANITGVGTILSTEISNGTYILVGGTSGTVYLVNKVVNSSFMNVDTSFATISSAFSANIFYTDRGTKLNGISANGTLVMNVVTFTNNSGVSDTARSNNDATYPYIIDNTGWAVTTGGGPAGENIIDLYHTSNAAAQALTFARFGSASKLAYGSNGITTTAGSNTVTSGGGQDFTTHLRNGDNMIINGASYIVQRAPDSGGTTLNLTTTCADTVTSDSWSSLANGFWDASQGRCKIDVKATYWPANSGGVHIRSHILHFGNRENTGANVDFYINGFASDGETYLFVVRGYQWNGSAMVSTSNISCTILKSETNNQWQTFELEWKCGSWSGDRNTTWTVNSDGYLSLYWYKNGGPRTLVCNVGNIALSLNPQTPRFHNGQSGFGRGANSIFRANSTNFLYTVTLGLPGGQEGAFGPMTNFAVYDDITSGSVNTNSICNGTGTFAGSKQNLVYKLV
jgi:hypothetical protein